MSRFFPEPLLSLRDAWLFDITCALIVHLIYNRFEPQPADPYPTTALLILVPFLPACALLSHLQPGFSLGDVTLRIALAYTVFYATLLLSIVLYRISPFHPLAKFPGPRLARVSQLWHTLVVSEGKRHQYFKELHNKYGPYVRVGPNEISCIDPKAIPSILGPDGLPKGPMWLARHNPGRSTQAMISLQDIDEHHRRRKIWNRAFSTTAVKDYEQKLELRATELVEELSKRAGKSAKAGKTTSVVETVDLTTWFSYFAFDFMGDMAFGKSFSLMKNGDSEGFWHMMEGGIKSAALIQQTPYVRRLTWKLPGLTAQLMRFVGFVQRLGRERIRDGSPSKDVFYYLMDEDGHEPTRPSLDQVMSDAVLVVIAGSDTTSTILGNIVFNLVSHPEVFSRLREEVDLYFPPGEADDVIIDSAKMAEMPYLNAIINEGMRMRPAVPVNIQRTTTRSEGRWVGSHYLPPGTAVNIPPYIIHRDEKNFSPLPETFWPDRWLSAQQRKAPAFLSKAEAERFNVNDVTTNHSVFIPFSYGPANCVGKNLAILELRTIVSLLVRRFDMTFGVDSASKYSPDQWEAEGEDWFVFKNGRLPVILTRRN